MKPVQSHPDAVRDALSKSANAKAQLRESAKRHISFGNPTPQSLLTSLQSQYWTRFHMVLIIAACVSMAVLTTRLMLSAGVMQMWVRYAAALLFAYGTFFMGVWVWLHLSQYGRHLRADWGRRERWQGDGLDIVPNINIGGSGSATPAELPFQAGGGNFDGGGAGGSWDVPADTSVSVEMPGSGVLDGVGGIAEAGGDEGGCLLIIAGILLAIALSAVFGATFYVIYQAPAILAEVIFEVLLGSPLARGAKALDSANWVSVLLKKTWKPFALMAAASMAFAVFCHIAFPQVTTAGQAIEMMLK